MVDKYETEIDLENTGTSHAMIIELVGNDKRVLDVGTSTGYLAEILAKRGCKVTGIEIDPEAARQAEKHCESVIVGDVESLHLPGELGEETFDVIVFGDVLEHLKDPLRTLRCLKPFLTSGGYVVASIPNIAHGSVRLALLQGKFQYHSLGLLDNTHLRFFTRESVEQLFKDAGFLITELERTQLGVFDTNIEVDRERIPSEALQMIRKDPEALTYQFVLKAEPSRKEETPATTLYEYSPSKEATSATAFYEGRIRELARKLRNFEELKHLLDIRTKQLGEKEREVRKLAQQVAGLNNQLAKMTQSNKGQP